MKFIGHCKILYKCMDFSHPKGRRHTVICPSVPQVCHHVWDIRLEYYGTVCDTQQAGAEVKSLIFCVKAQFGRGRGHMHILCQVLILCGFCLNTREHLHTSIIYSCWTIISAILVIPGVLLVCSMRC